MGTFAAVMTGKGTGAISTIQVVGDSAEALIEKIFKPRANRPIVFKPGKILLGQIANGAETIDEVVIGCETTHSFAINCHGNPLIVADIMKLLARNGATLLTRQELLAKMLFEQKHTSTIEVEAGLTQPRAKTLEGTKIIANQMNAGLSKKAKDWLTNIDTMSLKQIKPEAEQVLVASRTAKLIIAGCKIVLTGPPNTGKSTLLNCLAGKQKAIVTHIKGTTRDWVSAQCKIGPLCVEVIDTAGLDEKLLAASKQAVERLSQQKTAEILNKADLILLVLDNGQAANQLDNMALEKIADKQILTVLNKSDLPTELEPNALPKILANTVKISAKLGTGVENLLTEIQQIYGVVNFDLKAPVCFTNRQRNLLEKLKNARSKQQATSIITELLNGPLDV
ncbi:MAG: GTPase [Planctomycetota bacterium]|jgi:tRNA modification GTPase